MKLKKLFAGILAVAMMATMAAPAFAAKATDVETNDGKKDFEDVSIVTLSKDVPNDTLKKAIETCGYVVNSIN